MNKKVSYLNLTTLTLGARPIAIFFLSAVAVVIFFTTPAAFAEERNIRRGFWGGIDVGAGYLMQSFDEEDDEEDIHFYIAFKGGYTINPHFLIGLELSGWTIEPTDPYDPTEGEAIMQIFFISQLYPKKESGLFAKVGGGYVDKWRNNQYGKTTRKEGWGLVVGGGYDFYINEKVAVSPFANFSYGQAEDLNYKAITFGLGVTFP